MVMAWDLRQPAHALHTSRVHDDAIMCLALGTLPAKKHGHGHSATLRCVSGCAGDTLCATDYLWPPPAPGGTPPPALTGGTSCTCVRSLKAVLPRPGAGDVCLRPDGKVVGCGCWDGRVRLYSFRKHELLASLKYHRGQVTCVQFSPGSRLLASASRDSSVAVWRVLAPP